MSYLVILDEVVNWPRRYGKTAWQDRLVEKAVALGEHVHKGRECLSGHCDGPSIRPA